MSWCVYSCLMQINKCSVLCTTIMRPVVTEAAIAVLTIIFPRGRGQCGVCKMREAMLHVSSFNVFMPQLSAGSAKPPRQHVYSKIVYNIGSLPPHHSHQPSQAEDASSGNFYNIISNYAARNGTILLSNVLLSVDLYIQHKTVCLKRSNREQYFPCSNSTCMTETDITLETSQKRIIISRA